MIEIEIAPIPNQSFSIRLEDNQYDITIRESVGCMCATVVRNNITILSNIRLVAGTPLIPFSYLESGNFVLDTQDELLPDYTLFGVTQFLYYFTQAEVASFRAGV